MSLARPARRFAVALGLAVLVVAGASAQTSDQPGDSGGSISLAEVAARAAEIRVLLESQDTAITPSREVQAILDRLPSADAELRTQLDRTRARLDDEPPLAVLEQLAATWDATKTRLRGWTDVVTLWTTRIEQERVRLGALRESWQRSREAAASAGAPRVVLEQIDGILSGLGGARARVESRLSVLLAAQYRLTQLQRRCDEALARTAQAKADRLRRLGERDGPPLWSGALWTGAVSQVSVAVSDLREARRQVAAEVALRHAERVPLHVVFFLILVALLWRGRRAARRWMAEDRGVASMTAVFNRPISSALVLACLATPWIHPAASPVVLHVVAVVAIVPVIRLIRPSMDRSLAAALYAFGALYLVDAVRSALITAHLIEHTLFLAEMLAATAAMGWLLASKQRLAVPDPAIGAMEVTALRGFERILLTAFAVAFGLGAVGYLDLARLIGGGALGSSYYGLAIVAAVQVAKGLVGVLLRGRPLGLLASVQQHRSELERRILRALHWAAVLVWIAASLDALTFWDSVWAGLRAVLAAQWGWGAIRVSLGDLGVFAVTIWLSFVLAAVVRFLLADDVFPRVHLARGLPLAVSVVVQYVVIFAGITLALAALGVDLTKLTILAGAFGVGAGLGLQSLVNNFASGLILLFERPIHLGDVVQIAAVSGEVRHIGARATLVRTADGAEVFVPNSQLVAQTFTNWTYSDVRRRIVLAVRVAHGAAPQRVGELLAAVAARHPQVLGQPTPAGVFVGFGENSLDFELRAWTDRFADTDTIQSQLAHSIYAALTEAGIALSVPRRDVRLWTEPTPPPP
ncbi:MAG TPA: mechanosensitive ion channel domain-containing protein [Candidatus Bathyarchaeia archaeon]|nr:mechanosensitive ion channel domain-containing protein [Candidatus Bathyarchaeia archaeon]